MFINDNSRHSAFRCGQSAVCLLMYPSFRAERCRTISVFQGIICGSFSQGNSLHRPQKRALCSLQQACTLHTPDSAHSGTRPSASMQPGQIPLFFFGQPVQHSPQAVMVSKSVIDLLLPFNSSRGLGGHIIDDAVSPFRTHLLVFVPFSSSSVSALLKLSGKYMVQCGSFLFSFAS